MEKRRLFSLVLLIKIGILLTPVSSDDVFGCGGFVKSHAEIDFSKVEIKLLTKGGSVKDKTDCSPSNGYYFIPVYDKGEYVLKVSPPSGWSFEPDQFEINFDGKTDLCSQGKDINFNFKGFGITGRVGIQGQRTIGAKDVRVEMISDKGNDVRQTYTDKNGVFEFTPVIPGNYLIRASHDRWSFSKSEYNVVVRARNTEIPVDALIVSGFDVHGKIFSDGQPFKDVHVALYPAKGQKSSTECKPPSEIILQTGNQKFEQVPLCLITTVDDGEYIFSAISPGKYLIRPHFKTQNIKFHVRPEFIEVEVINDGVVVKENFEITGFDVTGRVLASKGGKGVPNAVIKLNGEAVSNTMANGSYVLQNMKSGTFTIQVSADNMQFADHTVKITKINPQLPDIVVSDFKVCGTVVSQKSHAVGITKSASTFHVTVETNPNTGDWCVFLSPGKYSVEVIISELDSQNGIQFFPITHEIEVQAEGQSGITFSQLRATVHGSIKCLPDDESGCSKISISMNALDTKGNYNRQYNTAEIRNGKYKFDEVLPGNYEISITQSPQQNYCWENQKFKFTIKSSEETVPTFVHTGYLISIISSHKTDFTYKWRGENPTPVKTTLLSGMNQFCVPVSGVYDMVFAGCHTFDTQTPTTFSTKSTGVTSVTASKHRHGIRILSEEKSNYKMVVQYADRKETVQMSEEKAKVDGYHSYIHVLNLKSDETVRLIPTSDQMLFKPETKDVTASNDCVEIAFSFIATKGLVINGLIDPPISDAKIVLTFPMNAEFDPLVTQTNGKGEFRFGPIDGSLDYEIVAEKESYVFSEYDKNTRSFKAHKLCEIIVTAKDEQGNKLAGVLLSLSGGESYRKNLVTGDDGTIKFHSLSPSQYFLRPMMKEYRFEPVSKMIEIKDGETATIVLSGKRIAFSAFGQVTSLNGDPFPNIIVEAVGTGDQCADHQEESSSELNGHFRIRGLQPTCTYDIQIKSTDSKVVDHSIPLKKTVVVNDDVKDVNIIAISPLGFVDVITRVYASQNDHYKTLRVQMYKKGNADNPIYSQRIESPLNVKSKINPGIMVFFPRIPLDGKTYIIELSTTLSDKNFKFKLSPQQFVANESSIYTEFEFMPEVRTADNDLNQNSISALVLIAIVAIIFFKQDMALEILNQAVSKIGGLIQEALNKNKKKEVSRFDHVVDNNEIEQLAQSINAVKKKKSKKIN